MLENLVYIFKIYIGLVLISLFAWKIRFWDECKEWICIFRYFYRIITILWVILFFAVWLRTLDVFFIASVFVLILIVDFIISQKYTKSKIDFFKVSVNQRIYDLIDGLVKFKRVRLKFRFEYIILSFVFLLGLLFWMKPAIKTRSLLSMAQHSHLVEITSMLLNNFKFKVNDIAMNSLCAFFSLIFGINQYTVLHLFGGFNFAVLFVGVSLLTYKLTGEIYSVILSASLFSYLFGRFNFISNSVEGSSLLLGIAWLFFVLNFWKDMKLYEKILSLFVLFLIDLFIGLVAVITIPLSELIESTLGNLKLRKVLKIVVVLICLFGFEIYLRANPELGVKTYALFHSLELIVPPVSIMHFLMLVLFLILIFEFNASIFHGIFSLLLLILTLACELSILSFVSPEQFYPIIVLDLFIWFTVLAEKIFKRRKYLYNAFVFVVVLVATLSAFLYGESEFDSRIEPDEFVEVVSKIQKEETPFGFAIVSHYGTRAMVENWAYFMDWDYFLKTYIFIEDNKKIYDVVYVIVPKESSIDKIHLSFVPQINNLPALLDSVCLNYLAANSEIYFEGSYIKVYKLKKLKSA
jgi:hypothetical protein